jgi:hypothetical protein
LWQDCQNGQEDAMRRRLGLALCGLFSVLATPSGLAMQLERTGADLYAKGAIVEADFAAFRAQLERPGLSRLILVNSPGGNLWTALRVAEMVRDAKLDTVVSGRCLSGCSLLFVAGTRRQFGSGHPARMTLIGIHGAHDGATQKLLPEAGVQIAAFYRAQLGKKMDAGVLKEALYGLNDSSGFLLIPEWQRTRVDERDARFCPSLRARDVACRRYPGQNALSLGVVTDARTVALRLPAAVRL